MLALCMWVSESLYNFGVFVVMLFILMTALCSLIFIVCKEAAKAVIVVKLYPPGGITK